MNKIDYTGFKTKAFTVLERSSKSKWKVICNKCGKIYEKTIKDIKNYKRDGCKNCTKQLFKSKPNDWHLFIHYKGHARSKNRNFELTYEDFKKLVHSNCYYCGEEPKIMHQLLKYCKNSEPQPLNGIDRVDSTKGYTLDNCVPCCPLCNHIKTDVDQEIFLNQIEKIHNFRNVQRLSRKRVESSDSKWGDSF